MDRQVLRLEQGLENPFLYLGVRVVRSNEIVAQTRSTNVGLNVNCQLPSPDNKKAVIKLKDKNNIVIKITRKYI